MSAFPGNIQHILTQRLRAHEPDTVRGRGRRARRSRLLLGAVAAMFALTLALVGGVFAVHDEGFQLEGNATAADLSFVDIDDTNPGNPVNTVTTPGNLAAPFNGAFDWDSIFDDTGPDGTGEPKATLPAGFTDAEFVVDFKYSGNTFITSDDTTFATGSKDTLAISGWQCNQDNNVNSKTDIVNAYATILEQDGNRILYFGLEKDVDNGSNNVGIWLFQSDVSCESSGGAVDFSGGHTNGDLFLVSEFTNGGGVSSITAYVWSGNDATGALNPTPVASSADCLDTAASGLTDRLCAVINGKTITMPWRTADSSVINAAKVSPNFFEGAINLTEFPQFANTCFTGFLADTRSAPSLTANIFDYALGDIDTCRPDLSLDKEPEDQSHIVGDSFDWTLTVDNTGDGDADDALVSDTIPDGLTINSATVDPDTAGSCVIDEQDIDCTVDVPAGESVDITVNVTSTLDVFGDSTDGCVTVTNTGSVSADGDESADNDSDSADATICRPQVSKTADGHYTETHTWSVTKSVDPNHHDANAGQTESSDYDVVVDETVTDSAFFVTGTITITNPSTEDDMTVDVTDALGSGESAAATDIDCDTDGNDLADDDGDDVLVEAGETIECTYTIDTGDADSGTNTATVTLEAGDVDPQVTATDGYTFSATVVGPTQVDVEDTFDGGDPETIGTTDGDKTFEYDRSFVCPTDETLYDENGNYEFTKGNTVEILDGDTVLDSDTASVTVDCWLPVPSKTADGSFDRDWDWTIDKTGDQTGLLLMPGQSFLVNYEVTLTPTSEDSNFVVSGTITIDNPNPEDDMTVDVTDALSSGESAAAADIDCGEAGDGDDAVIPAGGSIECTYSIDHTTTPAASDTGTNTATVTLEAGDDDPQVTATDDYAFALDVETDECVDLSDSLYGDLGERCVGGDLTAEYTLDVGQETCGEFSVRNVASFVTNDNAETGEDDHTVTVTIECDQGCTLTQGYWKTHSSYGPAPEDLAWLDLPDVDGDGEIEGPNEEFFLSGQTWYEVFWTAPKGNAYYNLAKQYMAAVLNGVNGTTTTVVDDELAAAEALFEGYTPEGIASLKGNKQPRPQFIELAGTLASYNEGEIGPGHCDEDSTSSTLA